ncbi:ATPase MORC2 [Labeo rohita]|uniref:ATPase MORC2 n=1 Tax=Labeo rohita TaxID=84645 RepID=A0ABQ8LZ56_LABRO|nr:ATPase MORC2 [Labeo rohita]
MESPFMSPLLGFSPELLNWENIPPNFPLLRPLIDLFSSSTPSLLDSVSPSAHPQLTICGIGSPLVCPSSAPVVSSLEDPPALPLVSEAQTPQTPLQSCNPAAPPWLPAPSSPPEPISPPAHQSTNLLGSLVPPAPPWSVVPLHPPQDCNLPAILLPGVRPAPEPPPLLTSCQPFAVPIIIPHPLLFHSPKPPLSLPFSLRPKVALPGGRRTVTPQDCLYCFLPYVPILGCSCSRPHYVIIS